MPCLVGLLIVEVCTNSKSPVFLFLHNLSSGSRFREKLSQHDRFRDKESQVRLSEDRGESPTQPPLTVCRCIQNEYRYRYKYRYKYRWKYRYKYRHKYRYKYRYKYGYKYRYEYTSCEKQMTFPATSSPH